MAKVNPPSYLQNRTDHTAQGDRMVIQSIVKNPGRVSATDLIAVQASTPNMSVDVGAGTCFVKGTEASQQGIYHCINDGATNVIVPPAHASLPRWDVIAAVVHDEFYSGLDSSWDLVLVQGTPAASPVEPALPQNAIKLARVSVAALATSILNANIINSGPVADVVNLIVSNTTERNRLTYVAGQEVLQADTRAKFFHDGSTLQLDEGAIVSTATPSHVVGRQWFNPATSVLQHSDGTDWLDRAPKAEMFSSSGTWTKKPGLVAIRVRAWGAGGAGGGAAITTASQSSNGGGGGGGGYREAIIPARELGSTEAVTVGAGGDSAINAAGASGGASSFGAHMTANGGGGGAVGVASTGNSAPNGGGGGGGTGKGYSASGGWGSSGRTDNTLYCTKAAGGVAAGGGGGGGSSNGANGDGTSGQFPGGGGSGGTNNANQGTARRGGDGANGRVIVEEYYA